LGILTALRRRGFSVSVFKKGPDYIDPAWLSAVSGRVCRNLDTYMVDPNLVARRFVTHADGSDIALIEGNRGIFDGKGVSGSHSTGELAKLLASPVVLVVDAAKSTRTVAAIVKGVVDFDPELNVAGVILNRVAGDRHLAVLSDSIAGHCGLPVLGAIPKLGDDSVLIPGRHLGLVTPAEYGSGEALQSRLAEIAEDSLDVEGIIAVARSAGPLSRTPLELPRRDPVGVKVGFFSDSVFTFYYPENLEALVDNGARLVPVSSLEDRRLPELDALYIGGGFPETHTEQLVQNRSMMQSVKEAALRGLPVYAECGGLIYLARSLRCEDVVYPMTGLLPVDLRFHRKPVGHGYAAVRVDAPNPFFPVGTSFRGHEFHYSGPDGRPGEMESCMRVERGVGVGDARDGLVRANALACYTHLHADGVAGWARAMVSRAADHASRRDERATECNGTNGWFGSEAI
jgi:cobyrinic acid a,c-diamide synthase